MSLFFDVEWPVVSKTGGEEMEMDPVLLEVW